MCGIAGIVSKLDNRIDDLTIKNITSLVSHRGIDGEGYYFGDNFAFGHRRLSIIDLSDGGAQPMTFNDKYVVIFNGAIYNFLEIKKELIDFGFKFHSNSDTEVLLNSYIMWGEKCVDQFNGMWSFTIFDKEKNLLFCSRDRFGVKPFYYYSDYEYFVFGSEIKQLIPFLKEKKINKKILIDYLVAGVLEHTDETFFENIIKLPAGHNLKYFLSNHKFETCQYYNLLENVENKKNELLPDLDNYEKVLKQSISIRLRSDVRLGTCLSGGIDSSLIATIASHIYDSDEGFIAIHSKTSEAEFDESTLAEEVSSKNNLHLIISEPDIDFFVKYLEQVIELHEEPFGSPSVFMQYFVFKKAKEAGCKVMLDGQGGDETMLGYEKYFAAVFFENINNHGLLYAIEGLRDSIRNNDKMTLSNVIKFYLGTFFSKLRILEYKRRTPFLKPYSNNFKFIHEYSKSQSNILKLQNLEITKTILPELLRYEDKNSMANSIESRLPFLDYKVVETALALSSELKSHKGWTKYGLRIFLENFGLQNIAWRKKKLIFNSPTETWMDEIKDLIRTEIENSEIIEELANKNQILQNLNKLDKIIKWRLFNIAVWERIMIKK